MLPLDVRAKTAPLVIVSGGQIGVDRAALDVALALGIPCSGWCPEGREARDGPIDERYPLHVLPGARYRARTRQNVNDTDGTLVLFFGSIVEGGGTELTIKSCQKFGKPCLELDAATVQSNVAAEKIYSFCTAHDVRLLNVAGPGTQEAYAAAYVIVTAFLLLIKEK